MSDQTAAINHFGNAFDITLLEFIVHSDHMLIRAVTEMLTPMEHCVSVCYRACEKELGLQI